ncbi:MAG: bifunctional diaminohydroxyphosphoribosylaminopyrimidine deaminase/5-amino-6-(5-phosphoribosylamino)uracil reductase RibD, partial [Gammaproteobacteria bacterium]|nr:bifunctional diaminohydroxyphosphoribosylaminopyrimidine deaminase/5-amino-6-(5-phosphoribosylamino)uracil reductase RibD [Gammaproteobacteria bacterium]
ERGRYSVSPNPMVGCVIVKDNAIVAEGFHQMAGSAHAEILALNQAGIAAQGATAYINLEPCCHQGRTPPCTLALIRAGIKKIYIACEDPNPLMAGKSIAALQAAGIEIELGLCAEKAQALNAIFFHYITHKRPFVIAKWAMSLDGKTITHPNDSNIISCAAAREHAHQTRQQVDAILIGANTASRDNPQLTVRYPVHQETFKHPLRIVLSSKALLSPHLKLLDGSLPGKTLLATTAQINPVLHKKLIQQNIEVLILPAEKSGKINLLNLLDELGKREITSLLVEGGMNVHQQFIQDNLVNQFQIYIAPVMITSLSQKQFLNTIQQQMIGTDLYLTADR